MLPIESMLNVLLLWVDFIQNGVRITLVAGSENDNLPFFGHLFEEGHRIRPDGEVYFHRSLLYDYFQSEVGLTITVIEAVNEGLVKIKDECFFEIQVGRFGQPDLLVIVLRDLSLVKSLKALLENTDRSCYVLGCH